MKPGAKNIIRIVSLTILLIFYLGYVIFIIQMDQGPVDYETFMEIGGRFTSGEPVYGENSYYPMPYVMIFGFFAGLPRPLSMSLWLLLPIVAALIITNWNPWVLIFAPLFGHFVGGQSALFGMLGFWGYHKEQNLKKLDGGLWLALTLLKPQLGLVPTLFAIYKWWQQWKEDRRIPRHAIGFLVGVVIIFLPSFILDPGWISDWLATPRPLALRAMAGLVPRGLAWLTGSGWIFWAIWLVISAGLVFVLHRKGGLTLKRWMLWYFIVSPLVHDYDVIQLIPLIEISKTRKLAVFLSIPLWVVIFFFYSNDIAWFAVTLIAPGLLLYDMVDKNRTK